MPELPVQRESQDRGDKGMTLMEKEREAIQTLADYYEVCHGECNPEGDPCEIMENGGDCIVAKAYLLRVRLGR